MVIHKDVPVEDKENNKAQANEAQSVDNKKNRTTFTDHQKRMLDVYFIKNPYPDPKETEDLSQQLVLPENVIKVWFQNKRSRDKQRKFSHASRKLANGNSNGSADNSSVYSSPLVANLQYLTSKINPYSFSAAVAAVAAAAASNHHHQNYYQY
jgi:hypothetical protein